VNYIVFIESVLSRTIEKGTNFKTAGQEMVRIYIEINK